MMYQKGQYSIVYLCHNIDLLLNNVKILLILNCREYRCNRDIDNVVYV